MPQQRSPAVRNSLWGMLLFIASGCSTSASVSNASPREWTTSEAPPQNMRLVLTKSALDAKNRYPSTVLVQIKLEGGGRRTCSGVLIDARLALTAAHHSGERRSGKNTVAALESKGKSFLVGQKGSHTLGGDSGGPCFRDGLLVGIATTTSSPPVELSEYTSTYFYRDWLSTEIKRARRAGSSIDSGSP